MRLLLSHKTHIGIIFLLFFLLSPNALLYSSHFMVELGHGDHAMVTSPIKNGSAKTAANHHHEGNHGAHHEDGSSCCDSHSHASILYQPVSYIHSPRLIDHVTGEPFTFIPEVYLDRFIPPQNVA